MGPVFSAMLLCMLWFPLRVVEHSCQAEKSWIIQPFLLSLTKTHAVEPCCCRFVFFFFPLHLVQKQLKLSRGSSLCPGCYADVDVPVQNSEGKREGASAERTGPQCV